MKCSYGSYVNKKLPYPFCLCFFFSFVGFFWIVDPSLYKFFFSYHEQCCLFEFPSLAVILRHSCRFINFIPYLMADRSHPFVPVIMSLVFKGKSLHTLNTNIFSLSNTNTSSVSLFSLCFPSPTLSSVYSNQPLHHDSGERTKLFPPQGKRDCLRFSHRTRCRWRSRLFLIGPFQWGRSAACPE